MSSAGIAQEKDTSSTKSTETAVFASGCFWGTEYMFQNEKGVQSTTVGYTGGHTENPTYKQVCTGTTGHVEALQVVFDPKVVSYETLARRFFETHDPTQANGQGPDIGEQYHSVLFYANDEQKKTAEKLMAELKAKGIKVATRLEPAAKFWPAEDYHQKYYTKTGHLPYCHTYRKLF
jgi:peptide methionine sulfoxide reductase msrA/msrB